MAGTETPLPLIHCDGGRKAAGFDDVTDKDCVTRSIAIGTGLPYSDVDDMVGSTAELIGVPRTEAGVNLDVATKLLVELGWQTVPVRNARLTREGLHAAISEHPVIIVQTDVITEEGVMPIGHLTVAVSGAVHDLPGMALASDPARARTDHQVVTVYRPPAP